MLYRENKEREKMNYRQPFVDQRWEDLENEIYQLENGLEK